MSHGLILLQDVCDKANCVSTDDRLFIGSIARFLEGIKKMNGAYSQVYCHYIVFGVIVLIVLEPSRNLLCR